MNIADFVLRLRDLISEAFDKEQDLTIALYRDREFFDYAKEVEGGTYSARIFHTVRAYEARADAHGVLRLAKLCFADRSSRQDLKQFITDLEKFIDPLAGQAAPAAGPPPAVDVNKDVLAQLESFTKDAGEKKQDLHALADIVRPAIRQPGVDSAVVADAFHLRSGSHQRLAAVLALEHGPKTQYLQWLAERIIVESPVAAMYAAQALTVFALKTPRTEENLNAVKRVLKLASHQLDNLLEDEDDPQLLAPRRPVDITTRKRQVQAALSILELRARRNTQPKNLSAAEFDELSLALISCFTVDELNTVLKAGIGMPLNRLVPVTDTLEQIVCRVLVSACENGWEGDLAFSVAQSHAGRPECQLPFAARFANPVA